MGFVIIQAWKLETDTCNEEDSQQQRERQQRQRQEVKKTTIFSKVLNQSKLSLMAAGKRKK